MGSKKDRLRIKDGVDRLKTSHLLTLIGDHCTEKLGGRDASEIEACFDALPRLQYGLQVNCLFRKETPLFEMTPGFLAFDLLGIPVLHGWIPDTHDPVSVSVMDSLNYNDAMTLLTEADDATAAKPAAKPGSIENSNLDFENSNHQPAAMDDKGKEEVTRICVWMEIELLCC